MTGSTQIEEIEWPSIDDHHPDEEGGPIRPLDRTVSAMIQETDFDDASRRLAEGMNSYLHAVNKIKPGTWPHHDVSLNISANTFRFKVGSRNWQAALGGTDSL